MKLAESRTPTKSTGILGIQLEGGPKQVFAPGNTIIGQVQRKTPSISPHACVTISLHGRSRSKILVSTGQTSVTYTGEFQFFDNGETTHTILDGPLHIPFGSPGAAWPFAITIPSSFNYRSVTRGVGEHTSYLPLAAEDVAAQPLPPTFSGGHDALDAFVEYFLHAELRLDGHNSTEVHHATLPVHICNFSTAAPIANVKLVQKMLLTAVASQRLIPGMHDAKLSFSQKAQKFFGSSKVPVFMFRIQVDAPTVIQLESPNPIPFLVRVNPDWNKTSEIIRSVPQKVTLTRLNLYLKSDVEVRCERERGGFQDGHVSNKLDLCVGSAIHALGRDIEIACTTEDMPSDVGEAINLRVGHLGLMGQKMALRYGIYPDFTTYNIKQAHRLKWELTLSVAGEKAEAMGQGKVVLLPPVDTRWVHPPVEVRREDSWIHPPAEDEPPPFVEAQGGKAQGVKRL